MSKKTYHHGNLQGLLIEKSIEMINENGTEALSMRKLATACGVSHTAPYAHFKDKDELLNAVEVHITKKFVAILKESVEGAGATPEGLFNLGFAYVMFFVRNPQYHKFIFSRSSIQAWVDLSYEPYGFFKSYMFETLENLGHPMDDRKPLMSIVVANLSMVHGLASLMIMADINDVAEKEKWVQEILSENYLIFGGKENVRFS